MQRFLRSMTRLCRSLSIEFEPDALRLLENGYRDDDAGKPGKPG